MFDGALPMAFLVQLGIILQPELDGTADDRLRNNLSVGLGDYLSVDGAGLFPGGSSVVLGGLGNGLDLLGAEPLAELQDSADDTT